MTWNAYFTLATLVLVAGLGLVGHALISTLQETLERLWKRRFHWASERLKALSGSSAKAGKEARAPIRLQSLWPCLAALPVALLLHDTLLSLLAILVGVALAAWLGYQGGLTSRDRIEEHSEMLALRLRSLLPVEHSVLACLQKARAEQPPGELALALSQVCARLEMKQAVRLAYEPLLRLPGATTHRLAVLLVESVGTREIVQMELLALVESEIHHRRLLRSKIRQSLTLVRGTIRVLQGAVAAGLVATVSLPMWREYFLADASHRTLLVFLVALAALASLYFEYEVMQMMRGEGL